MATKAEFLSTTYGAYDHREVPSQDAELTHVGPGSSCGEYFRRFWQPVARSEDLTDLPRAIRILGEDLVVFRDRSGRVGLLELHCSHRGTSLEFGIVAECGIRCCYHGWLYDVDGKILETPGEPADSTLKDRLFHGAYPVQEYKGLVFAYMGPEDKKPDLPVFDSFHIPGHTPFVEDPFDLPCNWLQIKENSMDPAHLLFLHATVSGAQVGDEIADDFAEKPELDYMETPAGMVYIDTRRVGDQVWVRIADYMPPNMHQFPPSGELLKTEDFYGRPESVIWAVPIDDTSTRRFRLWQLPPGKVHTRGSGFGQTAERSYEERQRHPGDYDAQVSQRSVAVHALEHLAYTDRGVIMFRTMVRQGIQAVKEGKDPKGVHRDGDGVIATYCCDTLRPAPVAPTPEEDRALLRRLGRSITEEYLANPPSTRG